MTARCYTVAQTCELLQLKPRTFRKQRNAGRLPFLEELKPRLGRFPRYRADLIDRYLANKWNR